ncbi:MAG: phytoene/squalene synthase family protein [Methylococcales bacterium]|nr:phytoene/squalene synthase family protein [Methylococcales bacterium]
MNVSFDRPDSFLALSDHDFQAVLLEGVSRTFALTIPQLPKGLLAPVANAYLLCRIVDTVEDEVALTVDQKQTFCHRFITVVNTGEGGAAFADALVPLLSEQTLQAERALVALTPRVIAITHGFTPEQVAALSECVAIMAEGMPSYQLKDMRHGLPTLADMDRYCYHVAGCVGEMLAKLFCHYSPDIARHRDALLPLSVSFGQGLQMTNILKDIWDDLERGVCWLPQDVFTETGFDLHDLQPGTSTPEFRAGLEHLIAIARDHLENALQYTLLLPAREVGLRNFCLLALGMAILTLRKIKQQLAFTQSSEVKISRRQVKTTVAVSRLAVKSDRLLNALFYLYSRPLRCPDWRYTPSMKSVNTTL